MKNEDKRFRKLRNKLRDVFNAKVYFMMLPGSFVMVRIYDIAEKDRAWASNFIFRIHEIFPGWLDYRFHPCFAETVAKDA